MFSFGLTFLRDFSFRSEQINAQKKQSDEATRFHPRVCRPTWWRQSLGRIRRGLCHHRHLVHAVALPVLSESLLRSLVTKFLSILRRLSRNRTAGDLSNPEWRATAQLARSDDMFLSVPAERCPPNHTGDGLVLYGSGRLRNFHPRLRNFHRVARARIFS